MGVRVGFSYRDGFGRLSRLFVSEPVIRGGSRRGGKRGAMPERLKSRPAVPREPDSWDPPPAYDYANDATYRGPLSPKTPGEPPRKPLWKRIFRNVSRWLARVSA